MTNTDSDALAKQAEKLTKAPKHHQQGALHCNLQIFMENEEGQCCDRMPRTAPLTNTTKCADKVELKVLGS